MKRLRNLYVWITDHLKGVRLVLIIVFILLTLYFLIDAFVNYSFSHFLLEEIKLTGVFLGITFLAKIYHALFGKWFVLECRQEETDEYVRRKFPRSAKFDGQRGSGKDSTVSAMALKFRQDLIDRILDEMDYIRKICYIYDFDRIDAYLDESHGDFMTNSKVRIFQIFTQAARENRCWVREIFQKNFDPEEHLKDLDTVRQNPKSLMASSIRFKYYDGITNTHFLTMLIRYALLYVRYHYIPNYIFTNQPFLELPDLGAKVLSTNYLTIKKDAIQWVWPLVGGFIMIETEADSLYSNLGAGENSIATGTRDFKAFFRHFAGENSVWFQIGQRASRTEKNLRELDQAFVTIIDRNLILGGEKRRFFLNQWLSWCDRRSERSRREKARAAWIRRRSLTMQRIKQLENDGFVYVDLKVSRTEESGQANTMTVRQLLNIEKPIFVNYNVRLCFRIKETIGNYNTHFLEAAAEYLAAKNKGPMINDLPSWSLDLIMRRKDVVYMNYPVLNTIFGVKKEERPSMTKPKEEPDEKKAKKPE